MWRLWKVAGIAWGDKLWGQSKGEAEPTRRVAAVQLCSRCKPNHARSNEHHNAVAYGDRQLAAAAPPRRVLLLPHALLLVVVLVVVVVVVLVLVWWPRFFGRGPPLAHLGQHRERHERNDVCNSRGGRVGQV